MLDQNNTALSIAETKVLKTSHLKKSGAEYSLVLLSSKNIDQILALQNIAFADLTPEESAYLLRKGRDFFEDHFARGNAVLGILHEGKLIAQSIIVNPTAAHPKTGMVLELAAPPESLTILQGVIVDPAYRGNNLMGDMVEAWLETSQKNGRVEAFAEVTPGNSYSWSVFLKKGMCIESIDINPADNVEVYNMHGHLPLLTKTFNDSAEKIKACPQSDIAKQKKLLGKGYKGAKFDPANNNLEFRRPKKKGHSL